MKYPKEYLEEIKTNLKVSQVVGKSVKLKKRGKEFVGLSPFTTEKTPSFTVNDQKGFYHCFSSSEHGNIFDFLMKTENLRFGEAVKKLAQEAGMPVYRFTKIDEERERKWKIYSSILETYSNFCNEQLLSEKYLDATNYLKERGLTRKELIFFKIGYAHYANNFIEQIKNKFSHEEIVESGIFYFDEKNKRYNQRFRDRIIFPIKNISGHTIAFGGRIIKKNNFAKYINSPETAFYKKGNNLFNINNIRNINNNNKEVFLVEGYLDVVSLHKHGITNVISNQGTALTDRQTDIVWRFFNNLVICFDGDKGGKAAALRAAERLFAIQKPDNNIYFLFLPDDLDPDSYINRNSKEKFIKFSENKVTIHDYLWEHYYKDININNPSTLALFEKKILSLCNDVKDNFLKKYFQEYYAKKISDLTPYLNFKKKKYINYKKYKGPLSETKKQYQEQKKFSEINLKEYSLLYLIINNFDLFSKKIEVISEIKLSSEKFDEFKNELVSNLANGNIHDSKSLQVFTKESDHDHLILEINNLAPIRTIVEKKSNEEKELIFDEVLKEISKISISNKIESLENKVIQKMDNSTYQELLSLKKLIGNG